ncbi:hypothetical protein ABPG72_012031 [Tetrahymena utriculariae]
MDQSLTSEKLNFLHSLLDKELEGLKESSLSNSGMKQANQIDNHSKYQQNSRFVINQMQNQQEKQVKQQSSSIHLNSSLNNQRDPLPLTPLESSLNISRQNHQRSNSQTPIKDEQSILFKQYNSHQGIQNNVEIRNKNNLPLYQDTNQNNNEKNSQLKFNSNQSDISKNIRMSHDLQELQNKIMNLEKKITCINNPPQEDKENSYFFQENEIEVKQNDQRDLIEHSFSKNKFPTYDCHETTMEDDYNYREKNEQHNKNNMFHTFNNYNSNNPHNQTQIDDNNNNKKVVKYSSTNNYEQNQELDYSNESCKQSQKAIKKSKQEKLKSHEHYSEVDRNVQDGEIDEDTPMKRKYKNKQKKRDPSNEYSSSRFNTETIEGQYENKPKSLKRQHSSSTSQLPNGGKNQSKRENSKGRSNKFQLEKKIHEAETMLNNSKSSIKKSLSKNNSINRNNSLKNIASNGSQVSLQNGTHSASKRNNSNSINKNQKNIDQVISNHNEVQVLNKKIMQLKKQSEQDKQLIIKERLRNNELQEEVDKLNRKMKKMANQIEKSNALEEDYKKLMQSFEKSEYIRQQQKQLITNLKNELDNLKKHQHNQHQQSQDQNINERKRPSSKNRNI